MARIHYITLPVMMMVIFAMAVSLSRETHRVADSERDECSQQSDSSWLTPALIMGVMGGGGS